MVLPPEQAFTIRLLSRSARETRVLPRHYTAYYGLFALLYDLRIWIQHKKLIMYKYTDED